MAFEIGSRVRVQGDDEVLEVVVVAGALVGVVGVPWDAQHAPVVLLADRLVEIA